MEGFMSKHLIKILSICALVVLVPLIVVGVSLCVTEAVPVELTIYQGGEVYDGNEEEYPSVVTLQIDNQSPTVVEYGSTITVKKNSLITLSYPSTNSVVYDFDGWFKGTSQQITESSKAEELDTTYSFRITSDTNITALKNIKKYSIAYAGYYDDGTTPIEYDNEDGLVEYGENLYAPVGIAGATFQGWYVEGDSSTIYNTATFTNNNRDNDNNYITLTLYPIWSNQMTVTYYDDDETTVIYSEVLTDRDYQSYTLLDGNDSRVTSALTPGYEFNAWLYNGEPISSISEIGFDDGRRVALVLRETKIEIARITYYAQDGETVIAQVNVRREDYSSYDLLDSIDERVLANIPANYEFNAWLYNDEPISVITDVPFVDGEISLVLSVSELPSTTITYYTNVDSQIQISEIKLYEDEFNNYDLLSEGDSEILDEYITTLASLGYRFIGWTDSSLRVITKQDLTFGQNYSLYMNFEIVDYEMYVQYNAIDTDQVTTLEYNATNNFFAGYQEERDGYTFVGLVYNNVTYYPVNMGEGIVGINYRSNAGRYLSDEVIASDSPITVTALWQVDEEYGEYSWTVGFMYEDGYGQAGVYDGNHELIRTQIDDFITIFEDVNEEGYRQLDDSIIDTYLSGIDLDNLYVLVDGEYVKASITSIQINIDSNIVPIDYQSSGVTFKDILDAVNEIYSGYDFSNIIVRFVCTVEQ